MSKLFQESDPYQTRKTRKNFIKDLMSGEDPVPGGLEEVLVLHVTMVVQIRPGHVARQKIFSGHMTAGSVRILPPVE